MQYAKVTQALTRVNLDKLIRMKFAPKRLRFTKASKQEKSEEAPKFCPLVDHEVDVISHADSIGKKIFIDFENTQEAYRSKDTLELLRSLLVFKLCAFDFLVDKNKEVRKGLQLSWRISSMSFQQLIFMSLS